MAGREETEDPGEDELCGLSAKARAEVLKRRRWRRVKDHASGPIETRPVDLATRGEP